MNKVEEEKKKSPIEPQENKESYAPVPKSRNNSNFATKPLVLQPLQPASAQSTFEPQSSPVDPNLAIPDFLRNSRSNNRSSVNMDRPGHIPLTPVGPRLTAFEEPKKKESVDRPLIEAVQQLDDLQQNDKSDDTKTMFMELENDKSYVKEDLEENLSNIRDSVATISKKRSNSDQPMENTQMEVKREDTVPSVEIKLENKLEVKEEPKLELEHKEEPQIIRQDNSRAIEMLLEQNAKLHQEWEESKKQVAQLQQTKIKYDYVVTKAYKKVKEIMAENQELRAELALTKSDLSSMTTKLEAIQSVFGGPAIAPQPRLSTAAQQLRLKEKLNSSERSLHQPTAKDV